MKEKTVPIGVRVELSCYTTLSPPLTYSWSKLEGPIPRSALVQSSMLIMEQVRTSHAGTYVCKVNNSLEVEHVSSTLMVTGIVPYFVQAPRSYIEMDTLPDAYLSFNLEISFKPESLTGK